MSDFGRNSRFFCRSWDFDVAAAVIPVAVSDEAASVLVVIVTVVLEVGVLVMVTVVLEVGAGDSSGEFLVVRFFFGGLGFLEVYLACNSSKIH